MFSRHLVTRSLSIGLAPIIFLAGTLLAHADDPPPMISIPDLLKGAKDPDAKIRTAAVRELANRAIQARVKGNNEPDLVAAVPLFVELLNDKEELVRKSAARALGGLSAHAKDAIPPLIKALEGKNMFAAYALGRFGPDAKSAVPALIEALKDTTTKGDQVNLLSISSSKPQIVNIRLFASEALGKIGPDARAALPGLIKLVQEDKDELVRRYAVQALPEIAVEDPTIIPPLVAALKDPSELVRPVAVKALGRVGAPAVRPVTEVLRNGDPTARAAAAEALVALGPDAKSAVPELATALRDTDRNVRLSAATALASLGPVARPALADLAELLKRTDKNLSRKEEMEERGKAAEALAAVGGPAVPALREALKDSRATVRTAAADGLGKIGADARDAVSDLMAVLRDGTASVRLSAIAALGGIGPEAGAAAPALKALLKNKDKEVSDAAAAALEKIAPK